MKSTFAVLLTVMVALAPASFATTSGVANISAQSASQTVQVTDQKFNPIFGEVPYEGTCYRQVPDHTEYRCHNENSQQCSGGGEVCETTNDSVCNSHGCTSVPRRSCHQEAGNCQTVSHEVCGNETVYRSEGYTCTLTHTVQVGQTLAKTFNHSVQVDLTPKAQAAIAAANLAISVDVTEATVTAHLTNSFPAAILNYAVMPLSNDNGVTVQNSSEHLVIDLGLDGNLARKIDAVTADTLELGSSGFRFNLPNAAGLESALSLGITLIRTPSVWFNSTIYDSTIGSSILSLVSQGTTLKMVVPFEKLGLNNISNRHSLHVSIKLNAGKILNAADFQAELDKNLELDLVKVSPTF